MRKGYRVQLALAVAVAIIGPLVFLVARERRTAKPEPVVKAPEPASPASKKPETAPPPLPEKLPVTTPPKSPNDLLKGDVGKILEKHRQASEKERKSGHSRRGRQATLRLLNWDAARLWVLAYPEDALALAASLALDADGNRDDRRLAIYMLGVLAELNNDEAAKLLVGLARSGRDDWSKFATECLIEADKVGAHRPLYRQKAREGDYQAIAALGYWNDPDSLTALQEIEAGAKGQVPPDGTITRLTARSLEQLQILASPDWAKRLEPMLILRGAGQASLFRWALRVGPSSSMPGIKDLLRTRLDASEHDFKKSVRETYGISPDTDISLSKTYVEAFTQSFFIATDDLYFDDCLIAYASLGGQVTEMERARLRMLGYGCDPKERLQELLTTGK